MLASVNKMEYPLDRKFEREYPLDRKFEREFPGKL